MEMHNRFMNVPTTGVTLLLDSLGENPTAIRDLTGKYNEKINNGAASSKILEAFHMILCYEYQLLHNACSGKGGNIRESLAIPLDSSNVDIKHFIITSNEFFNEEDRALLYEILVLQLVITGSPQQFTKHFDIFYETHQEFLATSDDMPNLLMRVSECFADSYNLRCRLYGVLGDEGELEKQCTRVQSIIKSWMKRAEDMDWKRLASLLPKLTLAFGSDKIVSPLWDEAFNMPDDLGTLNVLCIMADACFTCENNTVKEIHYDQCMQEQFWSIVLRGLTSSIFQHRKQALYLMKRAVDFMETHDAMIRTMLKSLGESIVPFVCRWKPSTDPSIEQAKKIFFLIMEALEEKQKHLVLPALSHLQTLSKTYADHKSCRDCFDVVWLRCILHRILEHDNEAIKIFGLKATLQLDLDVFDEEFMNFLANVLNNTFLYEFDTREDMVKHSEPQIVELLRNFFARCEKSEVDLINTFIRAISRVSWCPVALIWLFTAVQFEETEIVRNIWTPEELKCVAALVEKNLMMHCLALRVLSHDRIVSSFKMYVENPLSQENLEIVINTLSSFPEEAPERTSITWWKVVDLLSLIVQGSDAALYVTRICSTFFTIDRNMKSLARIIALLLDAKLICRTNTCPAERALRQLFENLISADLRPYADPASILVVIEFMSCLINLASQYKSQGMDTMKRIVSPYGNAIIKVIERSLERKTTTKHDEYLLAITAFVNSIDSLDALGNRVPWWPDMEKQLERFEDKCMHIIANPDDFVQWCYAIKVFYLCREKTFDRWPKLGKTYIPPLLKYFKSVIYPDECEGFEKQNGLPNCRLAADCFETIAKLVRQVVTESPPDNWPPDVNWFEELRHFVETGSEEVIEPVAATLYQLLKKSPSLADRDLDALISIIRECWRGAFQLKRTPFFFSTVTQLTRLIVNSNFLKLKGAKEYAVECVNEMMTEGERVPLLKRIFLKAVRSLCPQDISNFRKPFMSCLLHGFVPQRDKRIELQTIMACLNYLALSDPVPTFDISLRAESVIILLNVMILPEAAEFRGNLLTDLLGILEQNKNKRYFDNSHLHRLKHRVMQTLLILLHFLNQAEIQLLHDVMCDLIIAESNQPSVRLMQQWILTTIYLTTPSLLDSIWNLFVTAAEKRQGSIVSLASIVFHVSQLLSKDYQTDYVTKAIAHLLPNCMGQQFNVRLYSQRILVDIFRFLPVDSPEATKYKAIFEGITEGLNHPSLMKNLTRIFDGFYFTNFHPVASYSLETIYYQFSRLTNVSDDEWIECRVFRELHVQVHPNILPLDDPTHLESCQVMLKSTRAAGELAEETCPSTNEGLSDIQKKIIPWKSMVPFYDELSEISKAPLSRQKLQNENAGIIVLASLIDRPANLGGLARTCEIFGAKELVMGNLKYTEDREFQALSVTAEKWITITEVRPHLLRDYLLEKQSKGWKLVGAEQTANSRNLLEMEFDKKTILLLGNEKDGIPANLIPLLDTCVEIPQNGVVRSLNVHVTGAICIWQYFKQHICM